MYVRFLTRFLSYVQWNRKLKHRLQTRVHGKKELDPKRLTWALDLASRKLPGTYNCLPQAIVGCWTLNADGFDAVLRVGVQRDVNEEFAAHAWVEMGGEVVIGEFGGGLVGTTYSHLLDLNGDQPS